MKHYRLSKQRIRRVLKSPDRKEFGVAPKTIAVMQKTGSTKHPTEIWLMYQTTQDSNNNIKINMISAWRYPGTSPKGQQPIIPEDTLIELEKIQKNESNS
jgi:hypothetical protein